MKLVTVHKTLEIRYELPEQIPHSDYKSLREYCKENYIELSRYREGEIEVLRSQIASVTATEEDCKCLPGTDVDCRRCSRFKGELKEVAG